MVFKKILAILFGGMLLCTNLSVSAYADTTYSFVESEVAPAYESAYSVTGILTISGTTAYCTSSGKGPDIVSITVEQTLQKQGFLWIWSTYGARWTKSVNADSIAMSNTKTGLSSGKYRLKTSLTLTDKYGKTETVTVYGDSRSV